MAADFSSGSWSESARHELSCLHDPNVESHHAFRRVLVVKQEETPEELKEQEIPRGHLGDFLTDQQAEWPIKCLTVRHGTAPNRNELEARRASGCVHNV